MALYGHFRTEHLLVHHRYVGTDKDAVTAKYDRLYRFLGIAIVFQISLGRRTLQTKKNKPWDRV